ncbi:MAG: NUDIX domain-containing protein [Candidatus Thalassarchaeaceae archaeon]|nr:NUDIX domain-containing protein [Candidatus Thalassarchaeaceae archaeon]
METSCGFVLVNYDSILLLQYPQGHWSFPKGHIEDDDEDHHSTALRELIEETGIKEIIIDENWNFRTEYTFKKKGKDIQKQVFWFLAETDELEVKISHEHTNYLWLNFEDCEKQLTFSQEKILLQSAHDYREKIKK